MRFEGGAYIDFVHTQMGIQNNLALGNAYPPT